MVCLRHRRLTPKWSDMLTLSTACFVPIIYFFFPETRGLALEDVDRLFATSEGRAILNVEDDKTKTTHVEKSQVLE